jgi:hypothetical protein
VNAPVRPRAMAAAKSRNEETDMGVSRPVPADVNTARA